MATEKRLIDVDEFLKWVVKRFHCVPLVGSCDNDSESIKLLLAQAPTVDAVQVVHGQWEDMYDGRYADPMYRCSVCKKKVLYRSKRDFLGNWESVQALTDYCPNCGAKMDGGLYEP